MTVTPNSWHVVKIGRVALLLNGFSFDSQKFSNDGGIPLIRIRDIGKKSTEIRFTGNFSDQYIVHNGDLLIGMDGDFSVEKWRGETALLNQRVCRLECKDPNHLNISFISYKIIGEIDEIHRATAATTVKHLSSKDILGIQIHLPPLSEQSKIAEVLSTVDRAIEQTEALIAKQQRIKTGLMQDLLTRGIDERGNLRSEATHAFKDSPVGRIPVEWACDSIVNSMSLIMDYRGRTPKKLGMQWGGKIPALSAMNVEMGKINFNKYTYYGDKELYQRWMTHGDVMEGDIVMTTEAPLGNLAQIPDQSLYILSQRVILLRGNSDMTKNSFIRYYLSSEKFRTAMHEQSSGTTATGIQRKKFEQLMVPLPKQEEQAHIAATIYAADEKVAGFVRQAQKFRSIKTGLMQDLLTGEVRVTPLLEQAKEATA